MAKYEYLIEFNFWMNGFRSYPKSKWIKAANGEEAKEILRKHYNEKGYNVSIRKVREFLIF